MTYRLVTRYRLHLDVGRFYGPYVVELRSASTLSYAHEDNQLFLRNDSIRIVFLGHLLFLDFYWIQSFRDFVSYVATHFYKCHEAHSLTLLPKNHSVTVVINSSLRNNSFSWNFRVLVLRSSLQENTSSRSSVSLNLFQFLEFFFRLLFI